MCAEERKKEFRGSKKDRSRTLAEVVVKREIPRGNTHG
jgi:hypothetical protein